MFKKRKEFIIKKETNSQKLIRYIWFILGIFIVALAFNTFVLPSNIVYGVSGIGVILKKLFGIDPAIAILIGSSLLLVLSIILLGFEKTKNSIIGSLLYPIFVKLTEPLSQMINISQTELIVVVLFGAVLTGLGMGLIFKSGFTTGGTDILNQIVSKYFHMSLGNSMFFTDGLIVLSGVFVFGFSALMYSIISLYILSILTDKVVIGISNSKAFYIITDNETMIKKYLIYTLNHNVTVLEASGGFTGNRQKVLMCIIPTKDYFKLKNEISRIDENAFFVVTDAYEVSGGK
ncbi:MAG: YitT family protein [Bacilli bacterium]